MKGRAIVLATALVLVAGGGAFAGQAETATTSGPATVELAAKRFKNCTKLNKVYPQGVGRPKAQNKVNGRRTGDRNHKKSRALYNRNTHLDRDKDGVACER